ncbi:hypothetical protein BGZ82_005060 [Podila clonocystis]|nr:hypothetical protein BGZ82_005060 [Podila clonocystis]
MVTANQAVVFLKPATGFPVAGEHLGLQSRELKHELQENEILLRNLFISSDPVLRSRMNDNNPYIPCFEIGKPIYSDGVSEVVKSKHPKFAVGAIVTGMVGWEEYTVVPTPHTDNLRILSGIRESKIPLSLYIGLLGMPGLSAFGALKAIGKPKKGETIYISAASGAVGQLAGQIAKLQGLFVIGSAGSDDKVEYLRKELKFDAAFNYKTVESIRGTLETLAPRGIDIYFDNVGSETLEAALDVMSLYGRVIACGHISGYNGQEPYGIRNLVNVIGKRLTIQGFIVVDYIAEHFADFSKEVSEWFLEGKIVYREDVHVGLESAPDAFVGMLQGRNFGKCVVKIADL